MQKFIIKNPNSNKYFVSIEGNDYVSDVITTDQKYEAKIFDSGIEAKDWLKMIWKKTVVKDFNIIWEVILVTMKNGINDFEEIMTWYSSTEN